MPTRLRRWISKTGMSINANIKLRDRTVMSIFTEMFTRQSDSLKNVR